jgi:uncharacterized SAM-binding protein YcdF (DUF218 family)
MKLLAAGLVIACAWISGLLAFAGRVERLTPAPTPPAADGIVALTGGSDLRLKAATDLLEEGLGQRLLVSGVDRKATRQDLWIVTGASKPLFDCCVDLGFDAADTAGNARETAAWTRAMRYRSLILVTADYHTPRALVELRAALPGVAITAYPVATPDLDAHLWLHERRGTERMAREYSKYLVALIRATVPGLAPQAGPRA